MTDIPANGGRKLNDRQRMNLTSLALQADFRESVKGEVRFDAGTRAVYARDSSNSRQVPLVICPQPSACPARLQRSSCRPDLERSALLRSGEWPSSSFPADSLCQESVAGVPPSSEWV